MNVRLFLISTIVLMSCVVAHAQPSISIEELVAKVYAQNSAELHQGYKMPWIEEVNVRSETRDWRLREQRYSLRLRPISLGERRASSKLYNSWKEEIGILKLEKIYDQVADIHKDWVKQDFISRKININENILDLLSDIEKVAVKQSAIDADRLNDLIGVRSRIATLINDNALKAINRKKIIFELSEILDEEYQIVADSINLESYITAAKEALVITDKPSISPSDLLDLETIDNEMELEKAEQNRVLDFVALQYRGPHDNDLEERVSLGMSFNLPFYTSKKLSIAKLQVEKERELYRIESRKKESLDKLKGIKADLIAQLSEYDSYKQLYQKIEKENLQLITNMEAQAFINPTIRLNHEIQVLSNQLSLLAHKENIIQTYLEYLKASDKYQLGISDLSTIK